MDERFVLHRLRATRLSALVAAVSMGVWFNVVLWTQHIYRWDLFIILCLMAAAKIGAMIYYRATN